MMPLLSSLVVIHVFRKKKKKLVELLCLSGFTLLRFIGSKVCVKPRLMKPMLVLIFGKIAQYSYIFYKDTHVMPVGRSHDLALNFSENLVIRSCCLKHLLLHYVL